MPLQFLSKFVPLVNSDIIPEFQVKRDELLILFSYDLLITGEEMHLIEVSKLIGKCLSKQLVVILRRCDVLREDTFLLQFSFHILLVEPIERAFMLHDLQYPAPVDFTQVLIVKVLVESSRVLAISGLPLVLILIKAVSVGENLFSEGALPLLMLSSDELTMFAEILVLDLILILLGIEMHLSPRTAQCVLVFLIRCRCGGNDSWFAGVVEHAERTHHN